MAPAPRFSAEKQQELILEAAVKCINETSITDFTMAKIAKEAGLSMGSVYKFVQSKEDILLALASQSFKYGSEVFDKVLSLPMSTPEKVLAVSLIAPKKLHCFDFDYELQSYATNEAVIRRASPMWTGKVIEACTRCESLFRQTLCQGIREGELQVDCKAEGDLESTMEEIIISGWAMTTGYEQVLRVKQTQQIVEGTESLSEALQITDPVIRSLVRLLNSYPWKHPITNDSLERIEAELSKLDLR